MVERTAPLDGHAQTAEAVVADVSGRAVRHLLLVVAKEGVGRGRAADLLDARAAHVVPVLLDQVAVVVLHLRQPILRVPHQRLLAIESLVALDHVAVCIIVEAVEVVDAVDRMVRPGVVVVVHLPVERRQPVGGVVTVGAAVRAGEAAPVLARHAAVRRDRADGPQGRCEVRFSC